KNACGGAGKGVAIVSFPAITSPLGGRTGQSAADAAPGTINANNRTARSWSFTPSPWSGKPWPRGHAAVNRGIRSSGRGRNYQPKGERGTVWEWTEGW